MQNRWGILWVVAWLLAPALALAHPGHGHTDASAPAHYIGEPMHALPIALGVAITVLVIAATLLARWLARGKR